MDVTKETAIAACDRVQEANARRILSAAHSQCRGCIRFAGEPDKRCMRSETGWDGCALVDREPASRTR